MRRARPILFLALCALLVASVTPVSFTQGPLINFGATTYVTDAVVCRWGISGDTTAEDTNWYRDGALFASTHDDSTLNTSATLPPYTALKNEEWRCLVVLSNGTDTLNQSTNITIQNSAPTTPIVTNASGQEIGISAAVVEGLVSSFALNSSDVDAGETLTYYLKAASFCSVTNAATGAVSCLPAHADVRLSNETEAFTQKNVTFWVDDSDPLFAKSASITVTFNITPVNDAPTLSIPLQSTPVNVTYNVTFNASDEENDYPLTASLDAARTDANISANVAVTLESNRTVRIVYVTSPTDWSDVGNRTVSINLTDARNASALMNFTLEITTVNRPPYTPNVTPDRINSATPLTYILSQGQSFQLNVSANDPDTATRSQSITFSDNTAMFITQTLLTTATNASNATAQINFTATNADVGVHLVTISVQDQSGGTNATLINVTVLNVNDPPVLSNQSADANNTAGNVNLTSLSAYLNAPFRYKINVTDPDLQWGDTLTFASNSSTFNVSAAGIITFTPTGVARNESINLSVTDSGSLSDSRIVFLDIRENAPPFFNETFPALNCSEGKSCVFNLSFFAKESDSNDSVQTYAASAVTASLGSLALNATSGLINFTPLQQEVGNYTLNITITDTHGASASQLLALRVNNTPDSPAWQVYDFSAQTVVETHEFTFFLYASDKDLLLPNGTENLTLTANLSWVAISLQQVMNDTYIALLSFTPNASHVGNQSLTLNVTDATGLTNLTVVNFTVYPKSSPPTIELIEPYGGVNDALVVGWQNVSAATTPEMNVTFPENTTDLVFEANATDAVTPVGSLVYTWRYDGATVAVTKSLTHSFGFFTNGTHNVSVTINNTRLESSTWTWRLTVTDLNRPPVLLKNFSGSKNNINISSTLTFQNYFVADAVTGGFYDADDDVNSNDAMDLNETLRLRYNASPCGVARLNASGNDLIITPLAVGNCVVSFTATDIPGAFATSGYVTVNVVEVPQGALTATVSSGGGGGGTTTRSTFIPLNQEVEKPRPLSIIAPKLVTIYENSTIEVPIELRNNWTSPLKGILLTATSNATGVKMSFDSNFIEELPMNGTKDVLLTVSGYRLGQNFEVDLVANVTTPKFTDNALVLFNSIEQSQEGKDVALKVTFAQDLLSQNQQCQELNELLSQANAKMKGGDLAGAGNLVDVVINGCKYLISKTSQETQRPGVVRTPLLELNEGTVRFIGFLALGIVVVIAAAGMLYYHFKTKEEYNF